MKRGCKDNCPFAVFFEPQDTEKFRTLKRYYSVKSMREMLSNPNTTRENKHRLLQKWYAHAQVEEAAQILLEMKNREG